MGISANKVKMQYYAQSACPFLDGGKNVNIIFLILRMLAGSTANGGQVWRDRIVPTFKPTHAATPSLTIAIVFYSGYCFRVWIQSVRHQRLASTTPPGGYHTIVVLALYSNISNHSH